MKILVTGSTGLIGSALLRTSLWSSTVGTYYPSNRFLPDTYSEFVSLDITDKSEVDRVIKKVKPSHVVHTAAIGSPDWCEKNKELSYRVNVEGTRNILEACKIYGSHLIFFSSNIVFNGEGAPYSELSSTNPVGEYGRHKTINEEEIMASGVPFTIIRTMCVYGWNNPYERKNFTTLLLTKNMSGEHMDVTDDVVCNFISAYDIASFVWSVIDGYYSKKIYHVVGKESLTHFDVAKKMISIFKLNPDLISPISSDKLSGYFPRPKDTRFTTIHDIGFIPMTIEDGLTHMRDIRSNSWKWV